MRASRLTGEMMQAIVQARVEPQVQVGEPTTFRRPDIQDGNIESFGFA